MQQIVYDEPEAAFAYDRWSKIYMEELATAVT